MKIAATVSRYLLGLLLPDEPNSELQANGKAAEQAAYSSQHGCESCRSQTAVRRIKRGLAWSRSTVLHQRGSALADFLERHSKATKLLRT
jgi:ribosomal protein L37AE/L43A